MELKTPLKKAITPPLSVGGGPSWFGSLSSTKKMLIITVTPSAILAMTHSTLN